MRLGISLSTDFSAFSSFRSETCELTSLSALIFVPFQAQEKIWRGLFVRCVLLFLSFFFFSIPCVVFSKGKERRFGEGLLGENYNRIAAGGLGGLSPRSALQHLLRLRLRRQSGLRRLQGSKQASNLQKKRRQGFVLDPSDILSFLLQKKVSRDREDVQKTGAYDLASLYGLVSFLFFHTVRCLFKRKREVWRGTPWWKLQPCCCQGFGRPKPAISVATPPPPPPAVGLRPLQGSKQASNLCFKNFKSLKGFIGLDLNEAVPNHPANVNDSQISGYTTRFSSIASSFVLFFILLPFVLKKMKKKNFKHERLTFFFHDPWTVIGAWTAIGDRPVIVDHCVVK